MAETITILNPSRAATPAENSHIAQGLRQLVKLPADLYSREYAQGILSRSIKTGVIYDLEKIVYWTHHSGSERANLTDAEMDERDALIEYIFGLTWPRAARETETS